jgi:conjugal transfer pilin signal peptidase TrbI
MRATAARTGRSNDPRRAWQRRVAELAAFGGHARRRWYLYGALLGVWSLAFVRVFVDPTPRIPILFNVTPSLPYAVAIVHYGTSEYRRGDFVVFSFMGEAQTLYPGLKKQPFFKIIRGVAGDRVTVRDRQVFVNGEPVGTAKPFTFDHRPLEPIAAMTIPAGCFYVQGTSPDSFDSRYRSSGLVRVEQIVAKVTPLL